MFCPQVIILSIVSVFQQKAAAVPKLSLHGACAGQRGMEAPSSGGEEEGRRGGAHKVARVITPARGMADLALAAQAF